MALFISFAQNHFFMKTYGSLFLLLLLFITPSVLSQNIELVQSSGSININGILGNDEWLGSKKVTLVRSDEWKINIRIKYDQDYLYVAFENLAFESKGKLNAEILIQTNAEDDKWNDNTYWFHSSYSNCYSKEEYYNWENCSTNHQDWKANVYPFKNGNDHIEFQISLKKLGLEIAGNNQIKIAFKLSDVSELHSYWPQKAEIQSPQTWGKLILN